MLSLPTSIAPRRDLPRSRWIVLLAATVLLLCVYYLNYGHGEAFDEGQIEGGGSPLTIAARVLSVAALVWALRPLRFRPDGPALLVLTYVVAAAGVLWVAALDGGLNDSFFINTLLQLPVLLALTTTPWRIDHVRWLRFIGIVLVLESLVDTALWLNDASLWLSTAFIGGVGNPSSYGLFCSIVFAFCLLHPQAGRGRYVMAIPLAIAAVMTKALFAVLAVAIVLLVWMAGDKKRMLLGAAVVVTVALAALTLLAGSDEGEEGFLEHKLSAAGALIGLVEYDVDSAATVSQRVEMHERTFAAIRQQPLRLLTGHLEGKPYWPMDSQLLTYLGSYGVVIVVVLLGLHVAWLMRAVHLRHRDGGFAMWSLLLFALIFATNRILDYFPVATLYFMLVAMVTRRGDTLNGSSAPSRGRSGRGSNRSSGPGLAPVASVAAIPDARPPG